jgi:hypothetical protein
MYIRLFSANKHKKAIHFLRGNKNQSFILNKYPIFINYTCVHDTLVIKLGLYLHLPFTACGYVHMYVN